MTLEVANGHDTIRVSYNFVFKKLIIIKTVEEIHQ